MKSVTRQQGSCTVIVLVAVASVALATLGVYFLWQDFNRKVDAVQVHGLPPPSGDTTSFRQVWRADLTQPIATQIASVPGRSDEFLVLSGTRIYRFDSGGKKHGDFRTPEYTTRLATDPTGRMPHILLVSSKKKWTGAIDYLLTTDYFLHAVDNQGQNIWTVRLDPKDVSSLEPVPADLDGSGRPVIVLSAGKRIFCYEQDGRQRWSTDVWHHPGTLAAEDLDGDGRAEILVALAPGKGIRRVDAGGNLQELWGPSEPLHRFTVGRLFMGAASAVSLRQLFRPNQGGVRFALAFFTAEGQQLGEVVLPVDTHPLSYSPFRLISTNSSGGQRNWITALSDGSLRLYSPDGAKSITYHTGLRLRTIFVLPQRSGGDLVVAGDHRGLTAWKVSHKF